MVCRGKGMLPIPYEIIEHFGTFGTMWTGAGQDAVEESLVPKLNGNALPIFLLLFYISFFLFSSTE